MPKPAWWDDMPAAERRAVTAILSSSANADPHTKAAIESSVAQLLRSRAAHLVRNRSDRNRRVLVGARLSRPAAEMCRKAAEASGRSLYRFVVDALQAEVGRVDVLMDQLILPGQQNSNFADPSHDVRLENSENRPFSESNQGE